VQKRLVLVCEGSLYPKKLPDVSGPDLGKAGRYKCVLEATHGGHEDATRR